LTVLAVLAAAAPGPSRAADRRPRIAVMDLRSLGTEANTAELLSEIALTEATTIGGVEVIGRSEINAVLGLEKQKQMFGCAEDGSCLAEIAGALGVDFVVIGSVGRIGQLYRLDMKLLDAKKARARDRIGETIQADQEKLLPAVQRAIRKLLLPISAEAEAAATAARQQRNAPTTTASAAPVSAVAPVVASTPEAPAPAEPSSGGSGWDRKRWSAVTGATGAVLVVAGAVMTGRALQETKYLRDVTYPIYLYCPPDCTSPRTLVDDSEDTWSRRMRLADFSNGLGWTLVGTSLWLGLSSDQPAPGEPRRFLGLKQRTWGYILAGTGVAVGAGGILFDKKAKDLRGEADDLLVYQPVPPYAMPNPNQAYARGWAATEYLRLRNRFFLQGGGLVAAGAALWFTGGTSAPPVAVDILPTSGGAMAFVSGAF
jgi:TolB-like protein